MIIGIRAFWQKHFGQRTPRVLALSFLLFVGLLVLGNALAWTNVFLGLWANLFSAFLASIIWGIFIAFALILSFPFKKLFKDSSGPNLILLLPCLLPLYYFIFEGGLRTRFDPSHRLHQLTGANLPAETTQMRCYFSGGSFIDYSDFYSFKTKPTATAMLIHDLELELTTTSLRSAHLEISQGFQKNFYGKRSLKVFDGPDLLEGWPDYRNWESPLIYEKKYSRHEAASPIITLVTDKKRERVYLFVGTY